jgi:hypothetical protein
MDELAKNELPENYKCAGADNSCILLSSNRCVRCPSNFILIGD